MEDCENILEVHMELSYKLEKFEGPLDLLLHLIEKNKVNIYDIPIAEITDQYMEYVRQMDEENLDVVSEFLVMAATLLDIKARMLLPKEVNEEGEEEDPRAELVMRLLEYKKYRLMSEELKDMESGADRVFYKDPTIPPEVKEYAEPVDLDKLLDGVTLTKLQKIFESVMKRQQDKIDPVRSTFGTIKKDPVSLEDKITSVLGYARKHRKFSFRQMLEKQNDKTEVVVTFLALLELMKVGKIHLTQEHPGIAGQALHIPALALGIDGVEGQGGFPGPGQPRQHHQLVPGDGDVDVFQVVLPGALDENMILHGRSSLVHNNIRRFGPQQGQQSLGVTLDLVADPPRRHHNGGKVCRRGMEHRGELLFHAHRAASAVDVARQGQQLLLGQHGHGLLPYGPGGLFQVQALCCRDVENVIAAAGPPGHQGLEHAGRVLAQGPGHGHPVDGAVGVIGVGDIGDLLLVQRPHDVGFFFLLGHCVPPCLTKSICNTDS